MVHITPERFILRYRSESFIEIRPQLLEEICWQFTQLRYEARHPHGLVSHVQYNIQTLPWLYYAAAPLK